MNVYLLHCATIIFPVISVTFLLTGPHFWYVAPLFLVPLRVLSRLKFGSKTKTTIDSGSMPEWAYTFLVYVIVVLQFSTIISLCFLFQRQAIFSIDAIVACLIVGQSSGLSIAAAHELIHRDSKIHRLVGRMVLVLNLYEHFYTEHIRGHHVRVGTYEDGATARFGESFEQYWRRTIPQQFLSAYSLEIKRLSEKKISNPLRSLVENRVIQGLFLEILIVVAVLIVFGFSSFFMYIATTISAIRKLEKMNYIEHWGLTRRSARVQETDSWDATDWLSFYGLIGLSRHADHHMNAKKTFQNLELTDGAPQLPMGYLSPCPDHKFHETAAVELGRLGLGPFNDGPVAPNDAIERLRIEQDRHTRGGKQNKLFSRVTSGRIKHLFLPLLFFMTIVVTAVVSHASSSDSLTLVSRIMFHTWILAAFIISLNLEKRVGNLFDKYEALSNSYSIVFVFILGSLGQYFVSYV